jgi:hypothetical protein
MEQKIWNKDNMIVEEFSGEFDDHNPVIGEIGDYLIKLPSHQFKGFFEIYSIFSTEIEFLTKEPIVHGLLGYYKISMDDSDFDEDMPIELYDSNCDHVRTITVKDLYDYWTSFNKEFIEDVIHESVLITMNLYDKTIKYIGKIKIDNDDDSFTTFPLFGNRNFEELFTDKLTFVTIDRIREMNITVRVLRDKDSLISAVNEIFKEETNNGK